APRRGRSCDRPPAIRFAARNRADLKSVEAAVDHEERVGDAPAVDALHRFAADEGGRGLGLVATVGFDADVVLDRGRAEGDLMALWQVDVDAAVRVARPFGLGGAAVA